MFGLAVVLTVFVRSLRAINVSTYWLSDRRTPAA